MNTASHHLRKQAEETAALLPVLMLEAQHTAENILSGTHRKKRPGTGEQFWQFRDYDPGDRPTDIDWRQSAKTDSIFTREKEREKAQNIIFWCADGPHMNFSSRKDIPTKAWIAKHLCLSLAIIASRMHETISLLNDTMSPGRTEKSLQVFARSLLEQQNNALPVVNFSSPPKNSFLILIGDFLQEEEAIQSSLEALSKYFDHGLLIQVLDPAEMDLPYQGRALFQNSDFSEEVTIDHVDSIQESYQQRIQSHIETVKRLCYRQHFSYLLHRTQDDATQNLLKINQQDLS